MISTADCEFYKETGSLTLSAQKMGCKHFPRSLVIKSHHTGREMLFEQIGPDHPRYDEDGWDGEMALYAPKGSSNVKILTIHYGD